MKYYKLTLPIMFWSVFLTGFVAYSIVLTKFNFRPIDTPFTVLTVLQVLAYLPECISLPIQLETFFKSVRIIPSDQFLPLLLCYLCSLGLLMIFLAVNSKETHFKTFIVFRAYLIVTDLAIVPTFVVAITTEQYLILLLFIIRPCIYLIFKL